MDLWDRICSCLHTRKITAQDVSKKHKMDLRLLHGVAYGHPWFGRWGYRFLCGSFGVKDYHYNRSLELLSSLELDKIIQDVSCTERCKEVKHIIRCYRDLSETNLVTLRDLFRFMLTLKSRAEGGRNAASSNSKVRFGPARSVTRVVMPSKSFAKEKSGKCCKFSKLVVNWDSRWPVKRLEFTANVIVEALKKKQAENNFLRPLMNRQEVRDAARQQIGDTGLIDYVLKSLNNVVVGDYIVKRMVNKTTRKLEYMIEEVKNTNKGVSGSGRTPQMTVSNPSNHGDNVYADVSYLYANVLLDHPKSEIVKSAARTVLNSKYFVKEWPFRDEQDHMLRFICGLLPSLLETETELTRELSIGEYIVVPLHSTIGDLKLAIQNAMRDTYCITSEFVVTDIEGTGGMGDDELIFGFIQSGLELWVRGYGLDLDTDLKYEGGADNWKVNCKCGAQDDDGERMIACDMCEVWHHTYCCGIEDSQAAASVFICDTCYALLNPTVEQPIYEMQYHQALMPSPESYIYYPDSSLLSFEGTDCLLS
ncbi:OLC1v1010271C2 [Oldenlandia corymbosa var. corymbosa]|nr:OLC1v1010271C2 [Oldenlandia corymbosa var. corymbosa]